MHRHLYFKLTTLVTHEYVQIHINTTNIQIIGH